MIKFLGAKNDVGIAMFSALTSSSAQLDTVRAAGELALPKTPSYPWVFLN
jgi:hypothetical protein